MSEPTHITTNKHGRLEPARFSTVLDLALRPEDRFCFEAAVRAHEDLVMDGYKMLAALCAVIKSPIERYMLCGLYEAGTKAGIAIDLGEHTFTRGPNKALALTLQREIGPFAADFALVGPFKSVVIECDGAEFHQDKEKDASRDKFMQERGWRVMRFTGQEIYQDAARCASIAMEAARGV